MLTLNKACDDLAEYLAFARPGSFSMGPGRNIINVQKGSALFFCVFLLWFLAPEDPRRMALYASLHGTYGLIWLLKDYWIAPDPRFARNFTLMGFLVTFLVVIGFYNILPILAALNPAPLGPIELFSSVSLFSFGLLLMMGSDIQKYYTLKTNKRKPKKLIKSGFFRRIRSPNYLGEMVLYSGFAVATGQYFFSFGILGVVWVGLFLPLMLAKDHRLSRKPGWDSYYESTGLILPFPLFK